MLNTKLRRENDMLRNRISVLEEELHEMTVDRNYYRDDADHTMDMYQELRERTVGLRWYERILRRVFT